MSAYLANLARRAAGLPVAAPRGEAPAVLARPVTPPADTSLEAVDQAVAAGDDETPETRSREREPIARPADRDPHRAPPARGARPADAREEPRAPRGPRRDAEREAQRGSRRGRAPRAEETARPAAPAVPVRARVEGTRPNDSSAPRAPAPPHVSPPAVSPGSLPASRAPNVAATPTPSPPAPSSIPTPAAARLDAMARDRRTLDRDSEAGVASASPRIAYATPRPAPPEAPPERGVDGARDEALRAAAAPLVEATPARGPEPVAGVAGAAPSVEVHIGTIEIRGDTPAPAPAPRPARPAGPGPSLGFDEYRELRTYRGWGRA